MWLLKEDEIDQFEELEEYKRRTSVLEGDDFWINSHF